MNGFHWIIEGELAGSGKPGMLRPLEQDMSFLRSVGIGLVVTLTREVLKPPPGHFQMRGIHFPIVDMGIPELESTITLCQEVQHSIEMHNPVVFHCKAGLGRTGMMLACMLVLRGASAEEAIMTVRRVNSRYVQSAAQYDFVTAFAQSPRQGVLIGV